MYVMLREVPRVSPRRPDTGALFAWRLIQEDRQRVVYGDSPEDLMRAICTRVGYPRPGIARDMVAFELMATARRALAIEIATQAQAVVLAALESEMPLGDRKLSSTCREALLLDRAKLPRHPMLLWPRSDIPLILVASLYAPVSSRARTLGATYIDDLDDLSLIETGAAILGWRIDQAPEEPSGEDAGNVSGQASEW